MKSFITVIYNQNRPGAVKLWERQNEMDERKIVRTERMGVFFGKIESKTDTSIVMSNARRLWYWDGAASLSELAQFGTEKPRSCKFPCVVDLIEVSGWGEIISVTEAAAKSIDEVPEWKQR